MNPRSISQAQLVTLRTMTQQRQAARILSLDARTDTPHTTRTARQVCYASWRDAQRDVITKPAELWAALKLDFAELPGAELACQRFPLRIPRQVLSKIEPGNKQDPVLRQYLPLGREISPAPPGFTSNPVGDLESQKATGLLHKYQGRALIITTGACAVHCRYCFRREFPYNDHLQSGWADALQKITTDNSVTEIILSGGDPLTLDDQKLATLIQQLEAIPHLETLRIHTRLPAVIPQRITHELLSMLSNSRLLTTVVLHINHANEIDTATARAISMLKPACDALLNQAVLLRGVNDSVNALAMLSKRLFETGALPYYLHQLDKVSGADHFLVSDNDAKHLMQELASQLPGYLVPRFVREIAEKPYKTPIHW